MEQGTTGSLVFRDLFASVKAKEIVGRMGMIAYDQRTNALYIHTDEKWVPHERPEEAEQRRQRERPVSDRLVGWVRAQLDATEAVARRAGDSFRQIGETGVIVATEGDRAEECATAHWAGVAEHIALNDPAAVLADVEAKRALLEQFRLRGDSVRSTVQPSTGGVWDDLIRMLAEGFRHRPGYEEAMRGE